MCFFNVSFLLRIYIHALTLSLGRATYLSTTISSLPRQVLPHTHTPQWCATFARRTPLRCLISPCLSTRFMMIQTVSCCCSVIMDLSSFEGPPVNDTRFSIPQYSKNVPRPCISISTGNDRSVESPSPSRTELSRPASTEVLSPSPRSRYHNGEGPGLRRSPGKIIKRSPWQGRNNNSSEELESRRPRSAGTPTSPHEHGTSRPSNSRNYSNLTEASSPSLTSPSYQAQAQGGGAQRMTSNDRLVWLEDQKVWMLTDASAIPPNPHPRHAPPSSPFSSYVRDQEEYSSGSPVSQASIPALQIPYTEEHFDPNDLPPPYESLRFTARNKPRLANESLWSAVARRVVRSSTNLR